MQNYDDMKDEFIKLIVGSIRGNSKNYFNFNKNYFNQEKRTLQEIQEIKSRWDARKQKRAIKEAIYPNAGITSKPRRM